MNLKDFVVPAILSMLTFWTFQYFFHSNDSINEELKSGQEFTIRAAQEQEMQKPLLKEVSYQETDKQYEPSFTTLNMARASVKLANYAGSISDMSFKYDANSEFISPTNISSFNEQERELYPFLVAFQEQTPKYYSLAENKKDGDKNIVIYKAESNLAKITKQFVFYDSNFKLDLTVTVEPKGKSVQPRVFIPAPFINKMSEDNNMVMALTNTVKRDIEKLSLKSIVDKVWVKPNFFGLENRYFVYALISDANKFSQRGYFTYESNGRVSAILEGPTVNQKTSWTLSFYCGPKIVSDMNAVDKRLEVTLDYGWMAFIAKGFVSLLNLINKYVANYGLSIIILAFLLALILLPINWKSQKNERRSSELQKKIAYLNQKYKDNPEVLNREKAEAIKKYGLPGMISLLPLFLQIFTFIGLRKALTSSIELYHAPFFGWIHDLSAADPYYVLPILFTLGVAMSMFSAGVEFKQGFMVLLMMLLLGAGMLGAPAGLSLYFAVYTWIGLFQRRLQKAMSR